MRGFPFVGGVARAQISTQTGKAHTIIHERERYFRGSVAEMLRLAIATRGT